jgi:hypothetical protein
MSYSGPGDIVSGAIFYGGLNAYNLSYASPGTNPCADLRRVSDSATMTMNILSTGAADVASALSFVGASSAVITKLYDQSGSGNHLTQATTTQQPALTFSASGLGAGQPTITFTAANNQQLVSSGIIQTQPISMAAFTFPTVNNGVLFAAMTTYNGVWMQTTAGPLFQINGGTGLNSGSITLSNWYRLLGVFNGASSEIYVNGTGTPGNAGTQIVATYPIFLGGDSVTSSDAFGGGICATGMWPSAFNGTQAGNLDTNLQYWLNAIPSDTFATSGAPKIFMRDWPARLFRPIRKLLKPRKELILPGVPEFAF